MTQQQLMVYLEGTMVTLQLTFISIIIGFILAFFVAIMRMSKNKILKGISWLYVWVIRGTPMFLQILIAYFAVPIMYRNATGQVLAGWTAFPAGVAALSLNTAAYTSEVIRSGIESIDKGQWEAAQALGMTKAQAMMKVIAPQTLKRLIPPFANELTTIMKDTSLVSIIGITELVKVSKGFAASGAIRFYFICGAIFLFMTTFTTVIFDKIEKIAGKYE